MVGTQLQEFTEQGWWFTTVEKKQTTTPATNSILYSWNNFNFLNKNLRDLENIWKTNSLRKRSGPETWWKTTYLFLTTIATAVFQGVASFRMSATYFGTHPKIGSSFRIGMHATKNNCLSKSSPTYTWNIPQPQNQQFLRNSKFICGWCL